MKRFYRDVSLSPQAEGGFYVLLDGKPLALGGAGPLRIPSQGLANLVVGEWQSQEEEVNLESMIATRILSGAQQLHDADRVHLRREILAYAHTDLLFYFAEDTRLQARQRECWEPVLCWAQAHYAVSLARTQGLMPLTQPEGYVATMTQEIAACVDIPLIILARLVSLSGSLLLPLALYHGACSLDALIEGVCVDETWQQEQWGEDAQAAQQRANMQQEVGALYHLLHVDDNT